MCRVFLLVTLVACLLCKILVDLHFYYSLKDLHSRLDDTHKLLLEASNGSNVSHFLASKTNSYYENAAWSDVSLCQYRYSQYGDEDDTGAFKNQFFSADEKGFSKFANTKVALDRKLADARPEICRYVHYLPHRLPSVSVIIVFNDEDERLLARTIHSLFLHTPRDALKEIILIDDNSNWNNTILVKNELDKMNKKVVFNLTEIFYRILERHLLNLPMCMLEPFDLSKIVYVRNRKRIGLAQSWNRGAELASGQVIIFLQSAVEVTANWLPPLVMPIADQDNLVTIPVVKKLDAVTFYAKSNETDNDGFFYWNLGLFTKMIPMNWSSDTIESANLSVIRPYKQDILSSSQFAISKTFFRQIGMIDGNFFINDEINWDLTFKLKNANSEIIIVPCSHVYLLDKLVPNRMFEVYNELLTKNDYTFEPKCQVKLIAETFLPYSMDLFYVHHPSLRQYPCGSPYGGYSLDHVKVVFSMSPFTSRLVQQTKSLVSAFPASNMFYGQVMNRKNFICLHVEIFKSNLVKIESSFCRDTTLAGPFRLDIKGNFYFENYCLSVDAKMKLMVTDDCFFGQATVRWSYNNGVAGQLKAEFISFDKDPVCLEYHPRLGIQVSKCDPYNFDQNWTFN